MSETAHNLCHEVVHFANPTHLIRVRTTNSKKKKETASTKRTLPIPCTSSDFKNTRDRAVNVKSETNPNEHGNILTRTTETKPKRDKNTSYRLTNTGVNTTYSGPLRSEYKSVTSLRNREPIRDARVREKNNNTRNGLKGRQTIISKDASTCMDLICFRQDKACASCIETVDHGTDPCPDTQDSEAQVKVTNRNKSTVILTLQNVKRNRSMIFAKKLSSPTMKKMGARRWALGFSERRKGADF